MMDFLCWSYLTVLQAHLTKRMLCCVSVTDAFPSSAIPSFGFGVTDKFFIALVLLGFMFLTEPSFSQLGTSGMVAWVFRFSWHSSCTSTVLICNEGCKSTVPNNQLSYIPLFPPPSLWHNKSPHSGVATMKAYADFSFSLFADYTISQRTPLHLIANHSNFQIYTIFWKNHSSDCFVMPSLNCGRIHI